MHTKKTLKLLSACILTVALLGTVTTPTLAQDRLAVGPGVQHGELDFPINWKRYYSYAEWSQIMHDLQDRYSDLADIESIGQSRMGRDQFLLTITAKSTGSHDSKPAMWIDGAIHGNEINGVMCSLYTAWYLLTRYEYDQFVHDLVNSTTFYILPGLNVDANESYAVHPNTPHNPREPYRPEDNDGDGLYDEDQNEDVDGDGELSYMYIEDADGPLKLSPDGRLFVQVTDTTERVMRFRRIGSEGYDNDGDGLINEDDIGGPDPNRNYPYDWNLQAGNPYTMSEPETRNTYEFMRTHDNIYATFHYHNIGRLIMFSVPPALERQAGAQAGGGAYGMFGGRRQRSFTDSLAFLRESNKWAQLFDRQVAEEYQHDMDVQTTIVTAGARILQNYRPVFAGAQGQTAASTYFMLGAYSYLIELWGPPSFAADVNQDGRVDDAEYLEWVDTELMGEGWIDPHRVQHPDLGEIWIGGSLKKHIARTPPGKYVEMEAQKNSDFVLYAASQFPKVEVTDISVTPETGDLLWVDVSVTNDRVYPTSSDTENAWGSAVKDVISLNSSQGIERIEIPEGMTMLDPTDRSSGATGVSEDEHEFRLKGNETLVFRYLVRMTGGSGWVEANVESFHGGTASKRINIRSGG